MVEFMAHRIEAAKDSGGVEAGQNKYRAYFVKIKTYKSYEETVKAILTTDGYEDCIVTE